MHLHPFPDKQCNLANASTSCPISSWPLLCNANRQATTSTCMVCWGIETALPKGTPSKITVTTLAIPCAFFNRTLSCHFMKLRWCWLRGSDER